MEMLLGLGALLIVGTVAGLGMSSINMTAKDKADLAAKPALYQALVKMCRWVCYAVVVVAVLWMLKDCVGRSGGSDCQYGRTGAQCGPG
ncbi:hypothetical protein [Caulobacter sp.]|uniref:hypothetical protein n=1 Tax=Caulobacter sp. TaxID=78 RepID=UPI003BB0CA10